MIPRSVRMAMVKPYKGISTRKQCELLGVCRSMLYHKPQREKAEDLKIMRLLDEQYFHTPFYGIRRIKQWLMRQGYDINRKRVARLMKVVGWQTLYPTRRTTSGNAKHPKYPYLLRDIDIVRPNQVWAIDITYIPMKRGFMYLCAIIDVHTRFVLNWGISNTMTALWCRSILEEAIQTYGQPEIFNSDQGSQFTSPEFTSLLLERDKPIRISMDGKGRAIDNIFIERLWRSVKYECVYLNAFEDGLALYNGLDKYFKFYNYERDHQSLEYATPGQKYLEAA